MRNRVFASLAVILTLAVGAYAGVRYLSNQPRTAQAAEMRRGAFALAPASAPLMRDTTPAVPATAAPAPKPAAPAPRPAAPAPKPAPRPAVSPQQARAEAILGGLIRQHPVLKGVRVTFGRTKSGAQAESYYKVGLIVVSPSHRASLTRILTHEVWHIIDWRDNHHIDWGERIPPVFRVNSRY